MNILDYKKYFFANVSAIWFYFCVFLYIVFKNIKFEPYNHNIFPSAKDICATYIIVSFMAILVFIILTILEIWIREYLLKKYFSKLNINMKFKIPKFIITIYNIMFHIGFTSAVFVAIISFIIILT